MGGLLLRELSGGFCKLSLLEWVGLVKLSLLEWVGLGVEVCRDGVGFGWRWEVWLS